ncbi:response regulator [Larkinella punicea]|uniref:histidine kinase n=1 Tax=Larkinella punicea TaxID=2315727 RepID=A0A368JN72_9BACT|nr:response regulator [Larkinella punicea]RCR68725.1 response regulator [Larkinella punicea]
MVIIMRRGIPALIVFVISFISIIPRIKAQNRLTSKDERELTRAEAHLQAFRNDSAIAITGKLVKAIKIRGQLNTPFGMRAQLADAIAFEQDDQGDSAIKKMLRVEQQSKISGPWEVHAKACLGLALLYEKIGRKESSKQQLELAKADIDRYGLDLVYPYFAIRSASWERLYGDKKKALFFAREGLHTASRYRLVLEEAISRMLLNMLLPESSVHERMHHSQAAVKLYQQLGDHTGCSYMFGAIASLHFQRKESRQALVYNDSTILSANRAILEGHERHSTIASAYRFRSKVFKQMGLLDSALANLQKGYKMELDLKEKDIRDKIIEIDSRYQNKYKEQQLEEHQLALRLKNNQLRFSLIIVFLVLVSAVGLYFGYRKQRQAKRKLIEQNTLIHNQTTKLKALDAAKSRFFANVSHELRTPLTLLLGPISTLLNENRLTGKQTSLLQFAHRSGKQLGQLVTDILDLGKMEMGKMELDERPTLLAAFFRSHFAQFESLAESRNLRYTFHIAVADDVEANLDQAKCRQILNNLLGNAFKFTPTGGQITATVGLADGRLQLSIADTGPGIHPDDMPHLFDRYFQTTRPGKPAEGGTGIGLALCHEYVQLLRGEIDAESTLDTGSVFRVVFPVVVLPANTSSRNREPLHSRQTVNAGDRGVARRALTTGETGGVMHNSKPTILVVEDNADLQAYIRLILSDQYQVVTADNGKAALERLRVDSKAGISLILSDLMMPVMDGYQLLRQLKSDDATRHLPVIMLTARADAQDKLRALRIGIDDYLLKPFDEEELLTRIANLLANQAARRLAITQEEKPDRAGPVLSQEDREWLATFEGFVQQNLADPTLNVPELAHQFAMSESTLLRQLKRLTGLSPLQYVQAVRMEEARRLLESHTNYSITQVAAKVGYADARSFARSFRTRFGKPPSELLET